MTGYGKSETLLTNGKKITIEIKSLNSKSADINLKSQIVPKDKELKIRKLIAEKLVRGSIEISINQEIGEKNLNKKINKGIFDSYMKQLSTLLGKESFESQKVLLATSILKLPDIIENHNEEISPTNWKKIESAVNKAIEQLTKYRAIEGKALAKDVIKRIGNIQKGLEQIKKEAEKRSLGIKKKLEGKILTNGLPINPERLEQELIFYIEKLDINEEQIRLAQHCEYFLKTLETEIYPGKKLGFIIQEIGREINTIGSKANNAKIQSTIVIMKDELEKAREQCLNIL